MQRLQGLMPAKPLHLLGFSLGGNFVLRVAAEAGTGLDIASVVAVRAPGGVAPERWTPVFM